MARHRRNGKRLLLLLITFATIVTIFSISIFTAMKDDPQIMGNDIKLNNFLNNNNNVYNPPTTNNFKDNENNENNENNDNEIKLNNDHNNEIINEFKNKNDNDKINTNNKNDNVRIITKAKKDGILLDGYGGHTFFTYRNGIKVEEDASTADTNGESIKVSVIIPVYKVLNYISRCVVSLTSQTMSTGIEFIFVDDKGDDGSIEVVELYAQQDPRIHIVYNSENRGSGPSRNAGIAVARGEYLGFVDPDDYVDANFYEALYTRAQSRKYDIVKGLRTNVYQNGTQVQGRLSYALKRRLRKKKMRLYEIFHFEHQTAIYRRGLLRDHPDIRFGDTSAAQDCTFLLAYTFYSGNIGFVFDTNYYYCFRNDSVANEQGFRFFDGNIKSMNERLDFLAKNAEPGKYGHYVKLYRGIMEVRRGLLVASDTIDASTKKYLKSGYDDVILRMDEILKGYGDEKLDVE